jgi:spermidine/putrescine transport system substrate-binding protein
MAQPISRRHFLLGSAAAALGGSAFLAACSSDKGSDTSGSADSATGSADTTAGAAASAPAPGDNKAKVRIASWPFYIENDQNPKQSPTIANFIKATGRDVDYKLAIDDNNSFTTKYQPQLEKGQSIGFDIAIPTSWMCARWIERGWVEAIPLDLVPNRVNLLDSLANPTFDPGRKYTMPYAIGQIGIAYNPKKTGFELKTLQDLLKPELKGKTTILSELRDTVGSFLLADGINPEAATLDQVTAAMGRIKKLREDGQFRKITGNSYIEDLGTGDTWACLAWSGDVVGVQADNPDVKWVVPNNNSMRFVDTMLIPKGGDTGAAAAWMNWIYDPAVAGPLYEAISYASPVKGATEHMSAGAATNPLLNPGTDITLHDFKEFSTAEFEQLDTTWADAIGS